MWCSLACLHARSLGGRSRRSGCLRATPSSVLLFFALVPIPPLVSPSVPLSLWWRARAADQAGSRLPWRRLTAFTLSNKAQHSRSTYGTKRSALRLHAVRAWFGRTIDSVSGMRQGWFPSLSFQYGFRQQTPTLKHAVGDLVSFPLLCFQVISIALMTDILRI